MKKKFYLVPALLVIASLLLAACGAGATPDDPAVAAAQPVHLEWSDEMFTFAASTPAGCALPGCLGVKFQAVVPEMMRQGQCGINWGDGSPSEPFTEGTHAYATPGIYLVSVACSKVSGQQTLMLASSGLLQVPLQKPVEVVETEVEK